MEQEINTNPFKSGALDANKLDVRILSMLHKALDYDFVANNGECTQIIKRGADGRKENL